MTEEPTAPSPANGDTPEQLERKEIANQLGDQDAVNLAGPSTDEPPADLPEPTAELVRRHPDWWDDEVKRDFGLIGGESTAEEATDTESDTESEGPQAPLTDAESTSSSSTSATIKAE